jgi:hypothetical protein
MSKLFSSTQRLLLLIIAGFIGQNIALFVAEHYVAPQRDPGLEHMLIVWSCVPVVCLIVGVALGAHRKNRARR